MKKLLLVLIIFSLPLPVLAQLSQSGISLAPLKVFSPTTSSVWQVGQTYKITWNTTTTNNSKTVNISLHNASCLTNYCIALAPYQVALDAPNTGSFIWTIPKDLNSFYQGYQYLRISPNYSEPFTSEIFTISSEQIPPPTNGVINITSPVSGETWYSGKVYDIRWQTPPSFVYDQNLTFRIEINPVYPPCFYSKPACLMPAVAPYLITESASNTGSFTWKIPGDLSDIYLGEHTLSIFANGASGWYGNSGSFKLAKSGAGDSYLKITQPAGGEVWYKGSRQTIIWEVGRSERVYIKLRKVNGDTVRPISDIISNSGKYEWIIPTDLPSASDYQVRVLSQDLTQISDSNAFTITDSEQPFVITTDSSFVAAAREHTTIIFNTKGASTPIKWWLSGIVPGMGLMELPVPLLCPLPDCKIAPPTNIALAGTPPKIGSFKFTLSAKDSQENAAYSDFTLVVNDGALTPGSGETGSGALTPGSLIKKVSAPTVFYITPSGRRLALPSMAALRVYDPSSKNIKQALSAQIENTAPVVYVKLSGNPAVFKLEQDKRRWISFEIWQQLYLAAKDIEILPTAVFDSYSQGKDL